MKHDDLIEKLEQLKTPQIEVSSHKQALRMALLNSAHFKEKTVMNWAKVLAPIAAALLLIAVVGAFVVNKAGPLYLAGNQISRFSSYEQLQDFLKTNTKDTGWGPTGFWREGQAGGALAPSATDYSATNIQVAGVDEADIVKTDGEYIYFVSGQMVIIVKVYPPEQADILSEIKLEGTPMGIFINGDRLVLFEEETPYYPYYDVQRGGVVPMPLIVSPKTDIKVYDISDRENPQLRRELSAGGQYVSSRMIGDYAYVVINEPVYEQDDKLNLPGISYGGNETEIPATDIYYSDVPDYYYMYTTIMAINTQHDDQEPTHETILLGASSNVYVSLNNIYLTFPVWGTDILGRENWDFQKTSIHRIHIEGAEIEPIASGEVPGIVLNQFSMDEYDGSFRVATTTYGQTSRNNVYILDMDLNIVGSLTDLAPGETIHSARFMGERGYLVTFKKTDPLFVIDLSDPSNPQVLGELKITGYSDYLHPYDETHLIGIGKETVEAEEEDFAWYQGIKIAFFDVSDVNNPKEIGDPYVIGDRGTDSPVLYDHKAFLFDKSRNLLVIPVLVAEIDESEYPKGVPSNAYGKPVWQGAYVFHISPDAGLSLEGRITHIENTTDLGQDYYFYSPFSVTRSLCIGDVLYTISDAKIMMNNLENLDYINEVQLPSSNWTPPSYLPNEPQSEKPSPDAQPGGEKLPE
jgi:inhibitor of cysteine peptidase